MKRWLPWRQAWPGWVMLGLILVVAGPLFLRMPLWCDATLYDIAAWNLLTGGVHYRDVFDTNPPGFVWLVCGIRGVFGWSTEALRAADLLVVGLASVLLGRWVKLAGGDRAGVAWFAAGLAAFYLYTSEFNHVQRDVWLLLPAAAAATMRIVRIQRLRIESPSEAQVARGAALEAALWALGFWIKPHLAVVAAAVWLVSAPGLVRTGPHRLRRLAAEVLGQLFGLGVVAAAGVAWLIGSGAWPHFLEVLREWNPAYWDIIRTEQRDRWLFSFAYFPPWTDALRLALPLAMWNVAWAAWPGPWVEEPSRIPRAMLAAALLAWFAVGLFLQRPFHYVHVPEVFLMLAVFAANHWAAAFWLITLRVGAGVVLLVAEHHPALMTWHNRTLDESEAYRAIMSPNPAFDASRNRYWVGCLRWGASRTRQRGVSLDREQFGCVDPVQFGAVEDFLRGEQLRDGELLCWHDATHSLYRTLNVRPPIRYMHLGTAMGMGLPLRFRVMEETREIVPRVRYVVSDLHRVTWHRDRLLELDESGLPWFLPEWLRLEFPFDQPIVFRSASGRYLVHRVAYPVWGCTISGLDESEPPPGWVPPPWAAPRRTWREDWRTRD